jgi:benzoyl-CoA-dihydrodiol lyase
VSLPEVPLLAVLPGTGGLTRLTDKRKLRRDRADQFCTMEEGVRGQRALDWRLVDEIVPPSLWDERIAERAAALAATSDRPEVAKGIALPPLQREIGDTALTYPNLRVALDRPKRRAEISILGPNILPFDLTGIHGMGAAFWPLAVARELDDAILHLRANEPELGIIVFRSEGNPGAVLVTDELLQRHKDDWFVREIRLYWKRLLKRIDMTSRSLFALIEPGSCFAGTLAELCFAADRSLIFVGGRAGDNEAEAMLTLSPANFGAYPMGNGLTRLATRFLGEPAGLKQAEAQIGDRLAADAAETLGLVTAAYDEVDWDDEVRLMLEERASFSADALTGLEANLRFAGPETMETRIFGRLTAWQNWIFQRANAVGDDGALKSYGTGKRPNFDPKRV